MNYGINLSIGIVLIFITGILIGIAVGHGIGTNTIRKQAINAGVAKWTVDNEKNVKFVFVK